jgi:hypothetical protein
MAAMGTSYNGMSFMSASGLTAKPKLGWKQQDFPENLTR